MSEQLSHSPRRNTLRHIRNHAGIFIVAGLVAIFNNDKSGDLTLTNPIKSSKESSSTDNSLNVLSWNMHNETGKRRAQLKNLINEKKLDVVNLQEVNETDRKKLVKSFPSWYITYAVSDRRTKALSGGYGNVIMTHQKPENVVTRSFDGTSMSQTIGRTLKSIPTDTALAATGDRDFSETRKTAYEENRVAISMTISEKVNGKAQDIRFVNTHLGVLGDINNKQFGQFLSFVKENTIDDRPTIVCGDLNREPKDVIPAFADEGYITNQTDITNEDENVTVDYCSYTTEGYIGLGDVNRIDSPKTDHYPIIGQWILSNLG